MAQTGAIIRNWRDPDPNVAHDNAIVWPVFGNRKNRPDDPFACLGSFSAFTRHALQGHKASDHHQHANAEQFYYILSGEGEVLIGDRHYPIRPGTATYFPPKTPHQLFAADEDAWVEHLVITCPVDRTDSAPRVTNWHDATPRAGAHGAAVSWHLLESVDAQPPVTDGPCLLSARYLTRQALVRGKASNYHKHDHIEQIYYILEGRATLVIDDDIHRVSEGDTVYLPPGTRHRIINEEDDGWVSYLVIS